MSKTILITGGARSGKSRIAEERTLALASALGRPAVYLATARIEDAEMAERVARHQARRGPEWHSLAEPLHLTDALRQTDGQGPRLVDCLTLWLSNLMLEGRDWSAEAAALAALLPAQASPVVLVTNEVGSGIVPETPLGRAFRDAAGEVNQTIAAIADHVYLAVSGLPLKVK